MKIHFITYGDGEDKFSIASERLISQAHSTGWFETIERWNLNKISHFDQAWFNSHASFIHKNKRGNGYWTWKPKCILSALERIPVNDILLYLDAGCELNKLGVERFNQYIKWAKNSGLLAFYLNGKNYSVSQWTKKCLLDYFKISEHEKILQFPQVEAGVLFLKNDKTTRNFIANWLEISTMDNYIYINDSTAMENDQFIEHRHDQAIFTLLHYVRQYGVSICNENYFPHLWAENKHPILCPIAGLRNLTPSSRIDEFELI